MLDGQTAGRLTEVLSWAREISIIGAIVGASWKARGAWDDVVKFFDRLVNHMTRMENFADMVINNHLLHIERDLAEMARTQARHVAQVEHHERNSADEQDDNR